MKGLFWGLLTIDFHFFLDCYPEENSKNKALDFGNYLGGPATNASITFQHLGGNARLVTALGENNYTQLITSQLREHKLAYTDLIHKQKSDPIFATTITNIVNGNRTVFSYHPEQKISFNQDFLLNDFQIAAFDGFYIEEAIIMAELCRHKKIPTVFDGGSWKPGTNDLLRYIDIAICSENFYPPSIDDPDNITDYLLSQGVKKVVITRGGKPMIVNEGDANLLLAVPRVDVVDTLGAGDIFHGAFCFFYAQSRNFLHSLEKAAQIASFSCRFKGPRTWMMQ